MVSDDSEECSFLKSSETPVFQANSQPSETPVFQANSQPCPLLVIANILQSNFEPMSSSDSWIDSQTTILKLTRLFQQNQNELFLEIIMNYY